jgi:hypothetical protein
MRAMLAALLMLGALSAAQAQVRVERAEVLHRGIYKLGKLSTINDKSISTGTRTTGTKAALVRSTDTIRAGDGVVFGLQVMIHGRPHGHKAPFRVVWRYPAPGLRNPGTHTVKSRDEFISRETLDAKSTFYWQLGEPWTRVPGEWTFELWYGKRMLVSETFLLTK